MSAAPARVEYAVYAVFELARAFRSKKPISAQKIAAKYQISEKFVSLILQDLKKMRLVSAVRGPLGGFRLIPAPEELTLGYVVALAEKSNGDSSSKKNAKTPNAGGENSDAETARPLKKSAKRPKSVSDSKKPDAEAAASRTAFERAWREAEAKRQEFLNEILFSDLIKDSRPNIPPLNFSI